MAVLEKLTTAFNKEAIHKNPQREFNMLHYKMPSQKACTADLKTVYILRSIYRDIPIKYAVPGDLLYEELYTKVISGQFRATDLYGLCQRSGISISRKSIETMFQNLTHRQGVVPIDLARKTLDELAP